MIRMYWNWLIPALFVWEMAHSRKHFVTFSIYTVAPNNAYSVLVVKDLELMSGRNYEGNNLPSLWSCYSPLKEKFLRAWHALLAALKLCSPTCGPIVPHSLTHSRRVLSSQSMNSPCPSCIEGFSSIGSQIEAACILRLSWSILAGPCLHVCTSHPCQRGPVLKRVHLKISFKGSIIASSVSSQGVSALHYRALS